MSSVDRRLVTGPVPRVAALSYDEFLRTYRGRLPVVVSGAAAHSRAVRLWDPAYLATRCGQAALELYVNVYESDAIARRYEGARQRRTDLASLVHALARGEAGAGYLFNTEAAVFRVNARDPDLAVGRGKAANPGLAALAEDFALPEFVPERDLVYAALFLGSSRDKSPLHYDLGGEGKVMVQVRGQKNVVLFPPDQVRSFYLRGLFEPAQYPFDHTFVARADPRAPDFARFPELASARGLEAVLEPGDVLYWPPFWFHDFANLSDPTFAAVAVLEELRPSVMLFREVLDGLGRRLLARHAARGESPPPEVVAAFRELEEIVLAPESVATKSMWNWIHTSFPEPR